MAENKWLFGLTTFLSLLFFNFGLVVMLSVFSFIDNVSYFLVAAFSLIFGLICGIIINKTTDSSKKLIIGSLFISIISAVIIFFLSSLLIYLQLQMQKLSDVQNGAVGGVVTDFFGTSGNPFILAVLVFIFFNLFFIINNFRNDTSKGKNLLWYLYGLLILIALIFFSDFILAQIYNYPYVPSR